MNQDVPESRLPRRCGNCHHAVRTATLDGSIVACVARRNIIAPTASPIAEISDRRRSARTTRQKTDQGQPGTFRAGVIIAPFPFLQELMKYAIVPVTPFQQNATVLWCPETMRAAVVDPGGDLDRILDVVRREGLTLERVLVTHGHIDHAGGVADLAERSGVPIEGPHLDDRFWIDGCRSRAACSVSPSAVLRRTAG